jgi:6-phosphogluconolactonase (cycloisomerase 2 family)
MLFLLTSCPSSGGGDGGFGAAAPSNVVVSPNGSFLYVSNQGSNNVSAYTIGGTGALTPVTGSPFASGTAPSSVAVSPNGSFLYVSNQGSNNVSAYTITGGTGVLTPLASLNGNPFAAGTSPSGVAVSPNGDFLYVSNQGSNNVSAYTITVGTGVLTAVAGSPFAAGTSPSGVTVSPNDAFLYVSNQGSNNVSAYTVAAGTGVLAPIAGSPF